MSGNMNPEAAEAYAQSCDPEICRECDKTYPSCKCEPESCEGEAREQAAAERYEARREMYD